MAKIWDDLIAQQFFSLIDLARDRDGDRGMWAEFSVAEDGWTVRFFVRRGDVISVHHGLDTACAEYDGEARG